MLKRYTKVLAAVALTWLGGSAYADQPAGLAATCDAGCTSCAPACPADCGGFYGSAGIVFLRACGNNNDAFSVFNCTYVGANPHDHVTSISTFDNGIETGYRFEVGYNAGSGWGARLRYFNFKSTNGITAHDNLADEQIDGGLTSTINTLKPLGLQFLSFGDDVNPTTLQFNNQIHIKIWDLDVTRSVRCGCLDLTGSVGLRYLQIYQEYNAFEALDTVPAVDGVNPARFEESQFLLSSHSANGFGPTLGLEARQTLWDNLRVYGQGKVGFIFCDGHQQALKQVNYSALYPVDLPNPEVTAATASYNRMITTTEVEVGLEYAHVLGSGSEVYLRAGLVGMVFGGVGNNSRSAVGAGTGQDKEDNLSLFGLNLSVGYRY